MKHSVKNPFSSTAAIVILAALLTLSSCQSGSDTPPSVAASPTPALSPEQLLQNAYAELEPILRKAAVLTATAQFLHDETIQTQEDETVAEIINAAAQASGRLLLPDPALLARDGDIAIISQPNAMGLYLYDLRRPVDVPALELTAWNLGLNAMRVTWGSEQVGVSYVTLGNDAIPRVHFVLAERVIGGWEVIWESAEEPLWWFNNAHATLQVDDNSERLVVTGQAEEISFAFDPDVENALQRSFELVWTRSEAGYSPDPAPQSYLERQQWVWAAAEPSMYATLVEFTERLVLGKNDGALALTTGEAAFNNGVAFGLHLEDRYYHIVTQDEINHTITFKDTQGTFVASFEPPANDGEPWLISSVLPIGAAQPTTTPGN